MSNSYTIINELINTSPLYTDITVSFKTWINNQTRLNATNMNALTSFIKGYSQAVAISLEKNLDDTLNSFASLNAGWKYNPAGDRQVPPQQGEVFNDYTNNIASADYSHAEGKYTKAQGLASHAQNISTTASGQASTAMGSNTTAAYLNQVVLGTYNANNENNILEIGNGTSTQPKNIFCVTTEGKTIGGVNNLNESTDPAETLTPKGYVDEQIDRLDKNVWLGYIDVTTEQYHNETEFVELLNSAAKEFTKDTNPPDGRDPKNGDQITVKITNPTDTDPEYPEIWMFRDPDPKPPQEDPNPDGKWLFFSSLQQLVDATKSVKGLVQIGDNINVSDGLISVPIATTSILGVVRTGVNITNNNGVIDVPISTTSSLGVVTVGQNIQVNSSGVISVPNATKEISGVVKLSDNIITDDNGALTLVWGTW